MAYVHKTGRRHREMYNAIRAEIARVPYPTFGPDSFSLPYTYAAISDALRWLARRGEIAILHRGHAGCRRTPAAYRKSP